jgi:GTP-binding protein
MADIPGIIEGASEGRGLGLRFLRHIERNAVLLFMIPADADDIAEQYAILQRELTEFNPDLADKPRVLAISKSDMLDDELMAEIEKTLPEGVPHVFISAVSNYNLQILKDMLWAEITSEANQLLAQSITHRRLDGHHRVAAEDELDFEPVEMDDDEDLYEDFGYYEEDFDE